MRAIQASQSSVAIERPSGEYVLSGDGEQVPGNPGVSGAQRMDPVFPWDRSLVAPAAGSRRAALAAFITRSRHFAEVQANRLWQRLMGRGLVHPIDDFKAANPPAHPELLRLLADEFVKAGFDSKHVLRLIATTAAYQRSSQPLPGNRADETLFPYRRVCRIMRRIECAKEVLADADLPLKRVARALGWCHEAHFNPQFRHEVGRPPMAWRRRLRRERPPQACAVPGPAERRVRR